jgi:hypothetical protein
MPDERANRKLTHYPIIYSLSPGIRLCYRINRYDVHRHEANYLYDVKVDYDYVDHYRFRRVEKQLASQRKFLTHHQKRTWRWVFRLSPLRSRSGGF